MRSTTESPVYVFSDFRLDPTRRLLMRGGETVSLHPKAFELLTTLVENRDRVLTKSELLNTIWESQFVEENNLAVQISALRKTFGERSGENRYIVTVPGRGYRFVADVSVANGFIRTPDFDSSPETEHQPLEKSPTEDLSEGSSNTRLTRAIPYLAGVAIISALVLAFFLWPRTDPSIPRQWKLIQQTATGNVRNATLSGDGKFIVFSQTESAGESLWLRQIDTGSQTRIIAPDALEYVGLTISPDNNFIYFSTFGANQAATLLQRIPLLGGTAQRVAAIESGVAVSFSPDGRQFAYTDATSSKRESYLKVADADGGNPTTIIRAADDVRTIQDHNMRPVAWSPSGSEIALAVGERADGGMKTGVIVVDLSGVERFVLEPRFATIHSLVWLDRENLAFVASEFDQPTSQIWTVSTTTRDPHRVTNDVQDYLWISAGPNGELLTVQKNAISSLMIAPFEESTKTLSPTEIVHEVELEAVALAPDGAVLYTSRASGTREIWRVSRDGRDPKQITVDARLRKKSFAVSPVDGSLVFSTARGGKNALVIADREGKNLRRLTEHEDVHPQFMPDGRSIVFQRGTTDFPAVWRMGTDAGSEAVQLVNASSLIPTPSPDGSLIAYYFMDFKVDGAWRIGMVSAQSGELVGKLSFPTPVSMRRMKWHPQGKWIGQILNNGDSVGLLLLPTDGGTARTVSGMGKGEVRSFAWSADGKTLVYSLTLETQDAVLLTGSSSDN